MNEEPQVGTRLIDYGIEIGFLISGFFGSLMLVSRDASQRLGATVASLLAGTACANYLTPVAIGMLPEGVRLQGKYAIAFMMGFMGLKGLEVLIGKWFKVEPVAIGQKPKPKARQGRRRKR